MKKPINERRADWAHVAVLSFSKEVRMSLRLERELVVQDMLADLRHYCDRHRLDYANLDRRADDHYRTEIVEDGRKCKAIHPSVE